MSLKSPQSHAQPLPSSLHAFCPKSTVPSRMISLTLSGKQALDTLVEKVVNQQKVPGFVFGATTTDGELYFRGGGSLVVNDPDSGSVNPDSVFWICSQTKLITHIAALNLIEKGLLNLNTPVAKYLPAFATPVVLSLGDGTSPPTCHPATTIMRVHHLVNSTSGLFYPVDERSKDEQFAPYSAVHSREDPVSEFLSLIQGDFPGIPLLFEPGSNYGYGWGSDILGFIVEMVSGQTLEQHFKETIFNPLGMSSSFYLTPDLKQDLVNLSLRRNGKLHPWTGEPRVFEHDPSKVTRHFGGSGLYSSLRDYLALLRHLLRIHGNKHVEKPICSSETVRSLFTPTLPEAGVNSLTGFMRACDPLNVPEHGFQWSTALGLSTTNWEGRRRAGTAFWMGWAGTYFFMDPTTGIAGVFGTQVLPFLDQDELDLYAEFEKTLYAGLSESV